MNGDFEELGLQSVDYTNVDAATRKVIEAERQGEPTSIILHYPDFVFKGVYSQDTQDARDKVLLQAGIIEMVNSPEPHPHIVQVRGYANANIDGRDIPGFMMPRYEATAEQVNLDKDGQKRFALQIGSALTRIQQRHYGHYDVRADNVGIDEDGNFHLLDFNFARLFPTPPPKYYEDGGTIPYLPPELLNGQHSKQADVYMFATMLYQKLFPSEMTNHIQNPYCKDTGWFGGVDVYNRRLGRAELLALKTSTQLTFKPHKKYAPPEVVRVLNRGIFNHPFARYDNCDKLAYDFVNALG